MKMIVALLLGSLLVCRAEAQSGGAFQLFRCSRDSRAGSWAVWNLSAFTLEIHHLAGC